ncbi:TPA: hypothetical protein ACVU44_004905, partial [Vibrio parahaemolyticus]
ASGRFMEFIDRPVGANQEEIHKLETIFQITLPESMLNWWGVSDGPIVYFGSKSYSSSLCRRYTAKIFMG